MQPLELRLRELRRRRRLSQAQLAGKVGVTQATIAHWENGDTRSLKLETIDRLCRVLKTSPGQLIRRPVARPSTYEARIRDELEGLKVLVTDTEDEKAFRVMKGVLDEKDSLNGLDGRQAARRLLTRSIESMEHGAFWKAVWFAFDAGLCHGLAWGRASHRLAQFRQQRAYGSRASDGMPRGRPAKATDEQILNAAARVRSDLRLNPRELRALGSRLGYKSVRRLAERLSTIRDSGPRSQG